MNWHFAFVKRIDEFNNEVVIIDDVNEKKYWKQREELEQKGFELVWDSGRSLDEALQYAEQNYNAFPVNCVGCGQFRNDIGLFRGKKWSDNTNRWIPFNGYICEECAGNDYMFEVKYVQDYKPKLGRNM